MDNPAFPIEPIADVARLVGDSETVVRLLHRRALAQYLQQLEPTSHPEGQLTEALIARAVESATRVAGHATGREWVSPLFVWLAEQVVRKFN